MQIQSINPATEEILQEYEELSDAECNSKIEHAATRFPSWRETSFSYRSDLLNQLAETLRKDANSYAALITAEVGKPIRQSLSEVEKCAWVCEYYAENGERFLSGRHINTDASRSGIRYEPLGTILAIMPWNFPFWQLFRFAAPTLMAGNTALLKHASNVSGCSLAIESSFQKAGFPEHVFQSLILTSAKAERVVQHRSIKAVSLTGSEHAGRKVAMLAADKLKKSLFELGGSDPFIVLADADIHHAAKVAAESRTINAGQSCIAAKRFIVEEKVYDDFLAHFTDALKMIRLGDPMLPDTDMGPLARKDLQSELDRQVKKSVSAGARLLMGGEIPEGVGFFYPVTLADSVRPDMPLFNEETFGPVAPVIKAKSVEHAVELANLSDYGLGASVWTRDLDLASDIVRQIESGSVFVNGLVKSDPRMPFGGIKLSGYGRELSEEGIYEFTNVKSIWISES